MSVVSSARYRLICRLAAPPVEPAATEGALRRAFAFTETQLETLMRGGTLVATGLDVSRAEGMRQRLKTLGVEAHLEAESDDPAVRVPEAAASTPVHGPAAETSPAARPASADQGPHDTTAATATETDATVTCPRCGATQGAAATCARCGVVFAKLGGRPEAPDSPAGRFSRAPSARPDRPPAVAPSSAGPVLSLAASAVCAALAAVGSLGCLLSLRHVGSPGSDSAMVAAAGAGTLALWFALRAARDGAPPRRGHPVVICAAAAGGVGALALALLLVILAGGLEPPATPPDDRVAALRAEARNRWRQPTTSPSETSTTRSGSAAGLRYPDRSDRAGIQVELSQLGTQRVDRAEGLLRRSRSSLEGVSCRYTEPEPAWSSEGQMVYRLVYRCECFEGGNRRTGVVTLGVSFLWRNGRWIEGWAAGNPTETDAVSLFPAP